MAELMPGACGCGAVQVTVKSRPRVAVNCHCSICRKMNGSAFSTYAVVPEKFLRVDAGQEKIASYGFGARGQKHYCRACGTPLYNLNSKYPGYAMLYLGIFEADGIVPNANIFCGSGLPWAMDLSAIRSYDQEMTPA